MEAAASWDCALTREDALSAFEGRVQPFKFSLPCLLWACSSLSLRLRSGSQGWGISGQFVKCLLAGSPSLPRPWTQRELEDAHTPGSEMTHYSSPGKRRRPHVSHLSSTHILSFWGPSPVGHGEVLGNSARSSHKGPWRMWAGHVVS